MEIYEQNRLDDLDPLENQSQYCSFVYLKLMALPFGVYLYFILGFLHIIPTYVGVHSIILIGIIFLIALIFARHNATLGVCYFKQYSREFHDELQLYIRQNILRIGKTAKSNASFEKFIALYSTRIRNENYASIAANVFPTMGILGTFISIALTLPHFSSDTVGALENEITLLLNGVGTAFYVSIYGILLSLWWIFFEKKGLNRFEKEIEQIKEETLEFFWTKEEIEQAYLKENLEHFEKIGHMFEKLTADNFFERLGKNIEEKFTLFDEMLKLEANAIKMSSQHFKATMEILAHSQEKQEALMQIHQQIAEKLDTFNENTVLLHSKIHEEQLYIYEATKELSESLGESYGSSSHDINSLKESLKQIDEQTEEIIQKMDNLKECAQHTQKVVTKTFGSRMVI